LVTRWVKRSRTTAHHKKDTKRIKLAYYSLFGEAKGKGAADLERRKALGSASKPAPLARKKSKYITGNRA